MTASMGGITRSLAMQPNNFFFRNKVLEVVNVIASSVLLVINVVTMVAFTRRWFNCLRKGMRWWVHSALVASLSHLQRAEQPCTLPCCLFR